MTSALQSAMPPRVAAVFTGYPEALAAQLRKARALIFEMAERTGTGPLTETLKWGEPAYLTEASKSGSTLRIAWKPTKPEHIGVLLNCRTTLVETMRSIYPEVFDYQANRAVLVRLDAPLPTDALDHCARLAQTYHR